MFNSRKKRSYFVLAAIILSVTLIGAAGESRDHLTGAINGFLAAGGWGGRTASAPLSRPEQPAQPAASLTAADDLVAAGTYPFSSSSGTPLADMSSGTTQIFIGDPDDGGSATLSNIGFDFWYDGVRYTQFGANANGFIRLGTIPSNAGINIWENENNFASTANEPKIAAFYDDLCVGPNGKMHFRTTGTAPNRKLIVEWQNMKITRGLGCGDNGEGTFQAWLFESTGVVEFVYGPGMTGSDDGGYTIGLQAGAETNFASVSASGPGVSYTTADNTQSDPITAGTRYTFTPNVPAAPTGLTFTDITSSGMTLNWTDAIGERAYVIHRSTNNVNFTFAGTTAADVTTFAASAPQPGTTFYWRVYSVSEGALSAVPLSGNAATTGGGTTYFWTGAAAGAEFNTGTSWNTAANGSGSARTSPQTSDILIIDGAGTTAGTAAILTLNASASVGALRVTSNTSVTLRSSTMTTRTITITGNGGEDLEIQAGSTLSMTSGTQAAAIAFSTSTGMTGNIAGTLTFGGSGNTVTTTGGTGTVVTVASTGTVNLGAAANSLVGSVSTLVIANGANINSSGATSGAPPVPLATWGQSSNLTISGITTSTTAPTNNVQAFGNVTYNCPLASATMSFFTNSSTASIQTLTIQATNAGKFRAVTSGTVSIGSLIVNNGTFEAASTSGSVVVTGNVTQAGGVIETTAGNGSSTGNLRVAGHFAQSAGSLRASGASTGSTLDLNGTAVQNLTLVNAVTGAMNVRVNNPAGVNLTGPLAINDGAMLNIRSGSLTGSGTVSYGAGSGRLSYTGTVAQTATAVEFPSTAGPANLTINNTTAAPNDTVTLPLSRTVADTVSLTAGKLMTGGNTLSIGPAGTVVRTDGWVIGNLRKTYAAAGPKTFEVGTDNGYSPVAANLTAGTFPADFTARAVQGVHPNAPAPNRLARYWALSAAGVTADLTFNYLAGDVTGNENNYQIFRYDGVMTPFPPTSLDTGNHVATLNNVTAFSDWTLAEPVLSGPGTIQFSSTTYAGAEGATATINVTRSGGADGAVSIHYASGPGGGDPAAAGASCDGTADYIGVSGDLSWPDGDTSLRSFPVTLCTDSVTETPETVALTLTAPTGGATIGGNNPATLTINDTPLEFCNSDPIFISEPGPAPNAAALYPSAITVSGVVGTVSTVTVKLKGLHHTWSSDVDILLVGPDGQKFVLMSDVGGQTGFDAPSSTYVFSDAAAAPMTVGDGGIPSGTYKPTDYESPDTFPAPAPAEPYESPGDVGIASLNSVFAGTSANGTWQLFVVDDVFSDTGVIGSGWCLTLTTQPPAPGELRLSSDNYSALEGSPVAAQINRFGGSLGPVAIDYSLANGLGAVGGAACTAGVDYINPGTQTVTFLNGETTKPIPVTTCSDGSFDTGETFTITLSNPQGGATLGAPATATATINEPPPPTLYTSGPEEIEGDSGTKVFEFRINRSPAPGSASSVEFTTVDGSATDANNDYEPVSGTITFAPFEYEKKISVIVNGDTSIELDETFSIHLSNPTNAFLDQEDVSGVIINDDATSTFVVRSTGDVVHGSCGANCSLRDAVAAANANPNLNSIIFDLAPNGPGCVNGDCTITLNAGLGELFISNSVYILGAGADLLTINGGTGTNRVFNSNTIGNVILKGMTIESGNFGPTDQGGGLYAISSALLTLDGVVVSNNSSGDDAGGISMWQGNFVIMNSTITGNSANSCGGMKVSNGNLTITNSTFSNNTASTGFGGGVCFYGDSNIVIRNSTFTGNTSATGGGGIFNYNGSVMNIGNSIVAGNNGPFPDLRHEPGFGAVSVTAGYNLIGRNSGSNGDGPVFPAGAPNANNDLVGTGGSPIDAMLGPLSIANGGTTPTHGLLAGSPAIDKGSAVSGVTTDQRGLARPYDNPLIANAAGGSGSDIGAFEVQPGPNAVPVIDSTAPPTAVEDTLYTYNATADDPDGPAQNWSLVVGTHTCGGSIAPAGVFTFTPVGPAPPASCVVAIRVCDGGTPDACATQSSTVTINPVNDPPTIDSTAPTSATEDMLYTYDASVSDGDGPGAVWSLSSGTNTCPGTIVPATGLYTFTPTGPTPPASCVVGVRVCDSGTPNECAVQNTTVTIDAVNDPPMIDSTAPPTATEDALYTYDASVSDADGPGALWSLNAGMNTCPGTIVPATGIYTFTPAGPTPPASCVVAVRVCDTGTPNECAVQNTTVTIDAVNDPPVFTTTAPSTAIEDTLYTYAAAANDPDGPALVWSLVSGTHTCDGSIASDGVFTFSPVGPAPPASCVVAIRVCDTGTPNECAVQTSPVTITDTADAATSLITNAAELGTNTARGVPYTVKWSVTADQGTPGGSVTLTANGTPVCVAVALAGGLGQCDVTPPLDGVYSLVAHYLGSPVYQADDSPAVSHTVETPCTPPAIAYVDDDWAGTPDSGDPDGVGPTTDFGCDAFATIQSGVAGVAAGGQVLVAPGSYSGDVLVDRVMNVRGSFTLDGTLTVSAAGASVSPGSSPGIIYSGSLSLGAGTTTNIELNGTTVGVQYDQLNVTGTVTIDPAALLNVTTGFTPTAGNTFTIIANDGVDPVSGIFAGLPEGTVLLGGPNAFRVSYTGGPGNNDVILTSVQACPDVSLPTLTSQTTYPALAGVPVTIPISTTDLSGRNVLSADFTFSYDPAVLSPVPANISVTRGPVVPDVGHQITVNANAPGTLVVSVLNGAPGGRFTGGGVLVNLNMRTIGAPLTSSALTLTGFQYNNTLVCATVSSGSLSVVSGTLSGQVLYQNAFAPGPVPQTPNGPRPVPGVTVKTDAPGLSFLTGGDGLYSLSGFGVGPHTVTASRAPYLVNVNNGIYSDDASLIARHVVGLITLSPSQVAAGRVSGLPNLTSFEAALVAQYVVGIANPINHTGEWQFTPSSRTFADVNSDLAGQGFAAILMGDVSGDWSPLGARPAPLLTDPQRIKDAVKARVTGGGFAPGSVVTIPFVIDDLQGRGVVSYQFEIEYDPRVIEPAELAADLAGTMSSGLTLAYNSPEKGRLMVVVYGVMPVLGDGVYVNLRFATTGEVGSTTPLTIREFRLNDGTDDAVTTDGRITVVKAERF